MYDWNDKFHFYQLLGSALKQKKSSINTLMAQPLQACAKNQSKPFKTEKATYFY